MVLLKVVIFLCIFGQIYSKANYNPGLPYQPGSVNYPHPVPHPVIYNNVRHIVHPVVPHHNVHPQIPQYNPPPIYHQNRPNYQPQIPPFVQQTYSPVQHLPSLPQPSIPHLVQHRIHHHTTCVAHPQYPVNQEPRYPVNEEPRYPLNQDPQEYQEVTPKCYQTTNVRIRTRQSAPEAVSTPVPRIYETPPPPPPQPATTPPERPTTNDEPSSPATSNNDMKPILKIINTNTYTNSKQTLPVSITTTTQPPIVVDTTTSTTTPYPQVSTIPDNTPSPSPCPSIPTYAPNAQSDIDKMKQRYYKPYRNPYCYNCPYDPYMNMPYYDDYPQYPPPYDYDSNEAEYRKPKSVSLDKYNPNDIYYRDNNKRLQSVTIADAPEKEKLEYIREKSIPVTYPPIPTYSPPSQTKPRSIDNNGPYYPEVQSKYPSDPSDNRNLNYIPVMEFTKKQDASRSYPGKNMKIAKNLPKMSPKLKLKRKYSSSSSSSSSSHERLSRFQRVKYGYGKIDTHSVKAELSKRHILGHPVINPYDFKPFNDTKKKSKVYKSETDSSTMSDSKRVAEIKQEENVSQNVNNNESQEKISKGNQRASQSQKHTVVKTSEDLAEMSN